VVVIFDGDTAGKRAAEKAVPLFVDADLDGRVARLPAGQDPDDFVREHGADAFRKLTEAGRPMLDQFIQDAAQETTVPGRISAMESVAALLVRVRDMTTQELYARQLAVVLGLTSQQVGRAMRDARERAQAARERAQVTASAQANRGVATSPPHAGAATPAPIAAMAERTLPRDELELLTLFVTYPELASAPEAARAGDLLVDPAARELYRTARSGLLENGRLDVPAWLEAGPPDVRRSISVALMDEGISRADNPAVKLRALAARLELQRVEAEISMNGRLLDEARTRGDALGTRAILERGAQLYKTKQGLKAALQRP
jgi:DNA primase